MKKLWAGLLSAGLLLYPHAGRAEATPPPELNADAAILYNASTEEVLFEKNINTPVPPGSLTKIMTMLIASEQLKGKKITLEDEVTISDKAWKTGWQGSTMFLEVGQKATVKELMDGLSIASGNDAAVALAEHVAGSTDAFVSLMNKRAKSLKMDSTTFKTVNGLQKDLTETSTALDFLRLSSYYWEHFPKNMKQYHAKSEMDYETRPGKSVHLVNQNTLLSEYDGTVGLKTGWIGKHYNIVATVDREGMKMIAVLLGSDSQGKRTNDAIRLLQYGTNQYKVVKRNKAGDPHSKLAVYKSDQVHKSPVAYQKDVTFVVRADVDPESLDYVYEGKGYLTGGTKKGDTIGVQKVYQDGRLLAETPVVATETLAKGNIIQSFFDSIAIFFSHTLIDFLSSLLNRGD